MSTSDVEVAYCFICCKDVAVKFRQRGSTRQLIVHRKGDMQRCLGSLCRVPQSEVRTRPAQR